MGPSWAVTVCFLFLIELAVEIRINNLPWHLERSELSMEDQTFTVTDTVHGDPRGDGVKMFEMVEMVLWSWVVGWCERVARVCFSQ